MIIKNIMIKDELEKLFKTYLDQIPILASNNADWALLHYIIIFPDICGALESLNGEASGQSYIEWAEKYLADAMLDGKEWYEIRCHLLHQGKTTSKKRYTNYSFKSPEKTGIVTHKYVISNGILILDVHKLKNEVLTGIQKWFKDIELNLHPAISGNVEKNIKTLARVYSITGVPAISLAGYSISGTATTSYISPL